MSWREFRFNLRPITLLAIGCVVFTTLAVAGVCHWLLGLSWPIGFVLGAIVSPPDVVAPLAIARRLGLPRRLIVILEGEGLANDATALILYRFAVAAVSSGTFSLGTAVGTFVAIIIGEIVYGVAFGWLMLRIRQAARDPHVEMILSLVTPYLAFWAPEHLGGSGVVATVATGLYISWNGPLWITSATRLQGVFFWDLFTYLIEGLVFLLTGLQARTLLDRIGHLPARELLVSAAVICVVVIVARFVWMFPATYLPRWLIPAIARKDPSPPWQAPFMLAFTGIRGIVSLAAALAIPFATVSGEPFPDRDPILFLTFCVIVVTLVGQGLLMPAVIGWLGLTDMGHGERRLEEAEELASRRQTIEAVVRRLDELVAERNFPLRIVEPLRAYHNDRLRQLDYRTGTDELNTQLARMSGELERLLIEAERKHVYDLLRSGQLKDDARRRIERELDLREAQLLRTTPRSGNADA
jgi:CPA1 family monovalent cation:H+ antiporter